MRVLIAVMPLASHLYPSIPLAWALQNAGHEVRVASNAHMGQYITAAGLTAVSTGEEPDFVSPQVVNPGALESLTRALGFESPKDRLWGAVRHYTLGAFARYYAGDPLNAGQQSMADELVAFAKSWKPDLIIWDPACLPAPIAARACGAASARLLWGQDYFAWIRDRLVARLREGEAGVTEDPLVQAMKPMLDRFGYEFDEEMLLGHWTIDPIPELMRLETETVTVPVRWLPYNGGAALPDWLREPPARPRVALSLGLTTHRLFQEIDVPISGLLDMVADMDLELVATLADEQVAKLGTVPDNVRIVDYVPLTQLLPTCSAIIHHGGYGTFVAAATAKVPQLIAMEEGGDALATAEYIERRGAGIAVDSQGFSLADMKKGLARLLDDPSFRDGADRVYADMLAAPSPADVVPSLERLTEQYRSRQA
ncbi:activator-dependent family glycosyltransferase [Streptomyces sp. Je 1-79]|uniref:activator-dependent family glycosyltransferase n=1 Tax=Streptomyces sp. Je 1-79 TaxID=2943847 RepID=UPI0021A88B4C|nr:activator-dependent family glycosyltransferase [Streptomyces sp. Je 1-79]MCT4356209.1 activator-dependent family glycosyltransferase [Streptomyces sp. Je 1-79]